MSDLKDRNGLTETEYMASYRRGGWPLPSVTADQVLISPDGGSYDILLIRRGGHPCIGQWALPGGFVNEEEPPWKAAARELEEETSLSGLQSILLGVFGDPGRDIRGWTVTCAYCSLVDRRKLKPKAGDDAREARWFRLSWERQDGLLRIFLTGPEAGTGHPQGTGADAGQQGTEASGKQQDGWNGTRTGTGQQGPEASGKQQDGLHGGCVLTALLRPMTLENPLGQDTHYELLENQGLAFDHAKIIATVIPHLERLPIS